MYVSNKFCVELTFYLMCFQIPTLSHGDANSDAKPRITGGYRPPQHELAKHMVSIRIAIAKNKYRHNCGGSIIKPSVILTAAHCVTKSNSDNVYPTHVFEIAAGSPLRFDNADTRIHRVQRVIAHPRYETMLHKHDLGLLYLTQDIVEDGKMAQRIGLIKAKPAEGTICTAAGWGRIFNTGPIAAEVTYVDLKIFGQEWCYKHFNGIYGEKIICAKGAEEKYTEKGICSGDSGGPLFCGGALAGIASLGKMECGATGYVDVYTNVWYFTDWIENRTTLVQANCALLACFAVFVAFLS